MRITIRTGVSADAPALAELAARTFRETFADGNTDEDMEAHLAAEYGPVQQGRELEDPGITTLLVVSGGALAGYSQLRIGPPPPCVAGESPIEVWRFYVSREWHGLGIAQQLMDTVRATAGAAGAKTLWLGVWEHNPRAIAFYRKCGFRDVGSQIFVVGSDPQTDRIMTRPVRA